MLLFETCSMSLLLNWRVKVASCHNKERQEVGWCFKCHNREYFEAMARWSKRVEHRDLHRRMGAELATFIN